MEGDLGDGPVRQVAPLEVDSSGGRADVGLISLSRVDLPAPFGPMTAVSVPDANVVSSGARMRRLRREKPAPRLESKSKPQKAALAAGRGSKGNTRSTDGSASDLNYKSLISPSSVPPSAIPPWRANRVWKERRCCLSPSTQAGGRPGPHRARLRACGARQRHARHGTGGPAVPGHTRGTRQEPDDLQGTDPVQDRVTETWDDVHCNEQVQGWQG